MKLLLSCTSFAITSPRLSWRQFSSSIVKSRKEHVRDKTNVNIVTLGASQHGKTALCARLTSVLAKHGVPLKTVADIDHLTAEKESGKSQSATHFHWWSGRSSYVYSTADLPGSFQYIKNILSFLPHADLALLLVHSDLGVVQQTRDLYHIARHLGVPRIMPIINQPSPDTETLELVMMELEEMEGMEEPHVLVDMMGSEEEVEKFVQEVERRVWEGVRAREEDGSFYMVLEQVGNIPNRGTFCAGRVLSGRLEIGDQVEAFYQGKTAKAKVKDLEIYKEGAKDIRAGDRAGAFVSVKPFIEIKRGGAMYDAKTKLMVGDCWEVQVHCMPGAGALSVKGDAVVYLSTQFDGKVAIGSFELAEGDKMTTTIKFSSQVIAKPGDRFVLRSHQNFLLGQILNLVK